MEVKALEMKPKRNRPWPICGQNMFFSFLQNGVPHHQRKQARPAVSSVIAKTIGVIVIRLS